MIDDRISYKLEAREAYKAGEPVIMHFTLENKSTELLYVLKWQTPFEGFKSEMFNVTRNGEPVLYEGRMVKRANPSMEDYLVIKPQSSIDTAMNLSDAYSMGTTGDYKVEFQAIIFDYLFTRDAAQAAKVLPREMEKHQSIEIIGEPVRFIIN